jgi:hypothetical protein
MKTEEMIGKQFNLLTVEALAYRKNKKRYYRCKCQCGNTTLVSHFPLTYGTTKSCGCLKRKCGNENACWQGCGEISSRYWTIIKRMASDRGKSFEITIEDAWQKFLEQDRRCALSGVEISLLARKNKYSERTASLDRIDSGAGYTKDNIQWVHKDINFMKNDMSEPEFFQTCERILRHKGIIQ